MVKNGMSRDKNIFYNLVNNENTTTELFVNLFQFKFFLDSFSKLLDTDSEKVIFEYSDIETQSDFGDEGRPDILINNENVVVMIENKINNSNLTDNQPINYLKALENIETQNKYFIFLIPRTYAHLSEIKNRFQQWEEIKKSETQIKYKIIFWEEIYEMVKNSGVYELNIIFQHFYSLLKNWYGYENIRFLNNEVKIMYTKEIPEIMVKMNDLVKEVMEKVKQYYKIQKDDEGYGYGFFVKDKNGKNILFFGYWFELWRDKDFPIVFGANKNYADYAYNNFGKVFNKSFEYEGDWKINGLEKDILTSEKNTQQIIELILAKLEEIISFQKS